MKTRYIDTFRTRCCV